MKTAKIFCAGLLALACGARVSAQDNLGTPPENSAEVRPVNSFFERGPAKEYGLKMVYVGGEVENPGPVTLADLAPAGRYPAYLRRRPVQ